MSKKEPEIIGEIVISLYDDGYVDLSYPQTLTLDERIALLTQALKDEMETYAIMTRRDNQNRLTM
ncbi:MAG: hypothetical protein IJ690_05925 [Clostridia bacterium]|nr:hypothetical protein [Clostridia bacterium]